MTGRSAAPPPGRPLALYAVAVIGFAGAALAAAYLHWIWWAPSHGWDVLIALAAAVFLLVGGVMAIIGRRRMRVKRVALVVLAMGVGVVAGEALGPSREPLLAHQYGTMTLHLESPVVAVATGAAVCTNVASATEFMVSNSDMLIEAGDRPVVVIVADVGDRWKAISDDPRKDGVLLRIDVKGRLLGDSAKPGTIGMRAAETSTLTSTFSNSGGSIRFAGLVAQSGPQFDYNGESLDLAGTLEWTCGAPPVITP